MVTSAVLGAAVGTGLALFVALTLILYHYYVVRRRNKDWGDLERFEGPKHSKYSTSAYLNSSTLLAPGMKQPSRASVAAMEGGFGKCPYGTRDARMSPRSSLSSTTGAGSSKTGSSPHHHNPHRPHHPHHHHNPNNHATKTNTAVDKVMRWDSRGSRSSTKSCPPLYTYPTQEFNVDQAQRIVQPVLLLDGGSTRGSSTFASLPEVREVSSHNLSSVVDQHQHRDYSSYFVKEDGMLTRQSNSLPPNAKENPGQRLNRTPSISSQGSQIIDYAGHKGHRGSSPAIRTFTPEGVSTGVSPPDSPPLVYTGSRSPSPITNIRATSLDMKANGGSPSSNNSTVDLRISPLGERTPSMSQSSLNSLSDRTNNQFSGVGFRRSSRCLSPLLIPPKSPTASDGSSGHSHSPAPLSPLLGTLRLDLYQKQDVKLLLPASKQPDYSPTDRCPPLGQLHFSLKYDFDKSDLHVHAIEAQNLATSNQGGFNDPYLRLFLSPEVDTRKRQTSIHRNEPNPFFDEHFKFPVSQDDLKEKILILQVFDYDRYSRNDVVGQVSFSLEDFSVTTALDIWADVTKNKTPSGERQEILVSLSYLPSAQRLTVVLLKARNLYSPPNKDTLDPFVKVYLTGGGKRLKKKKTTARKNTKGPVWNESLTFTITACSLANACLEICVLDQSNDLMGTSAIVGSCVLGSREEGSELSHWQEMSQNFRKSIAAWHVLI